MKPRAIWLCFAACLALLLVALAWVTRGTLRMERQQQESSRLADFQQKVRLALWRMDGAVSAILIREGARPPEQFRAFTAPSMAWSANLQMMEQPSVVVPSPLLTETNEHVKLYFELSGNDLTSPQAPRGAEGNVALACFNTTPARISASTTTLGELRQLLLVQMRKGDRIPCSPAPAPGAPVTYHTPTVAMNNLEKAKSKNDIDPEIDKSQEEFTKRAQAFKNSSQIAGPEMKVQSKEAHRKTAKSLPAETKVHAPPPREAGAPPVTAPETVGAFQAVWVGSELLLIREVRSGSGVRHQGVWLDWASLRSSLLQDIKDLFPDATLEPATLPSPPRTLAPAARLEDSFWHGSNQPEAADESEASMQFVALPVLLKTKPMSAEFAPQWTPFRRSLAVAWGCVLLAALAVAVLLRGTVALSERRAAFVSAVTHELRTPLTTFRLYTEILSQGMLPTEERRGEYLATLQAESERLSHLVENVLAYARLERGSAQRRRTERLTLGELLARVRPALERRVELVQARLAVDEGEERDLPVEVDVAAVEQILFNLVDNACKYAAPEAEEKTIHLETGVARGMALLRVRDHGRGIQRSETHRIFRPFHKSAQQAAHSAPGVGLGLALCRKLSRALGGNVRLDTRQRGAGACFVLEMPLASA